VRAGWAGCWWPVRRPCSLIPPPIGLPGAATGARAGPGWLLGGRDGRLLLVAVGALLGAPLVALGAVTAASALSLGLRVGFLRRPPAGEVGSWR